MQVTVELNPEQLIQMSKDMQAAMPALIAQAAPQIIAKLLTTEGEDEEKRAAGSRLGPNMEHYARQRALDGYTTFRQSVINALVPEAKEVFSNHPELKNVAMIMAFYVIEHKREVMAEGFERFFSRMWSNMATNASQGAVMSDGLARLLKEKNFLTFDEQERLRSYTRSVLESQQANDPARIQ